MALPAGTRFGPYEIQSAIGAGGMGEVYRARDTRLDRTVAIKVLPEHIAGDPDLRQRFEREARAISSLDHPHICALYDVGEQAGTGYLVMQFLEGDTLAQRLGKSKGLGLNEALTFAAQIADALAAAHRHGVIHRDLKPGNIMLTRSGIKLLDFGLAKRVTPLGSAIESARSSGESALATEIAPATTPGALLGTVEYMAPEQLEGKDADARTDIFAFGLVLYEMLTGAKAFRCESHAALISAVLKEDPPPVSTIQPLATRVLDRIVAKCLAKNPDERWQSAADLASELKWAAGQGPEPSTGAPAASRPRRSLLVGAAAAIVALIAGVGVGAALWRRAPVARPSLRFTVLPEGDSVFSPAAVSGNAQFAISPDGRRLAFVASNPGETPKLWVRSFEAAASQLLPDTDGASFPFWSPDSRAIGFFARSKLKRVDASGGPPSVLADAAAARGGSWSPDGVIVFCPTSGAGLMRVSATGGDVVAATDFRVPGSPPVSAQYWPHFLPDGRHFLFFALAATPEDRGIYIASLDSPKATRLTSAETGAMYADGRLFYVRQGSLVSHAFDPETRRLGNDAAPVADRIAYYLTFGHVAASVSRAGVLAFSSGLASRTHLTWRSRAGTPLGTLGAPGVHTHPRLSPDERQVAVGVIDPQPGSASDIWLMDVARGTASRLTFWAGTDFFPVWSRDGRRIVFSSDRTGAPNLHEVPSSGVGDPKLVMDTPGFRFATDWSLDERYIVYHEAGETGLDIGVLPLFGDRKPITYIRTPFNEGQGRISPDGRWIAYISDESAKLEVYVQPFPATGRKWQISPNGGTQPEWRRDGKELFYISADARLMAVPIAVAASELDPGAPRPFFDVRTPDVTVPFHSHYAVTLDGQRFLVNQIVEHSAPAAITVVLDWSKD